MYFIHPLNLIAFCLIGAVVAQYHHRNEPDLVGRDNGLRLHARKADNGYYNRLYARDIDYHELYARKPRDDYHHSLFLRNLDRYELHARKRGELIRRDPAPTPYFTPVNLVGLICTADSTHLGQCFSHEMTPLYPAPGYCHAPIGDNHKCGKPCTNPTPP